LKKSLGDEKEIQCKTKFNMRRMPMWGKLNRRTKGKKNRKYETNKQKCPGSQRGNQKGRKKKGKKVKACIKQSKKKKRVQVGEKKPEGHMESMRVNMEVEEKIQKNYMDSTHGTTIILRLKKKT